MADPQGSRNAPSDKAIGCADCQHAKPMRLGKVGRCIATGCTCPAYDPPTKYLVDAMERGQWP